MGQKRVGAILTNLVATASANGSEIHSLASRSAMADEHHFDTAKRYGVPAKLQRGAHVAGMEQYVALYKESVEDLDGYWDAVRPRPQSLFSD